MKLKNVVRKFIIMVAVVVAFSNISYGQEKKLHYVSAVAQGTSTQLGRMATVSLYIYDFSTPEDQKVLIDAFQSKGSKGVSSALNKMHSKGRIAITGTLGFDVNYIREFPMPDGSTKIRFVTDRPITFGEAWTASRSSDYGLSMGEIIITADKDKNTGTILPVAKFKVDKEELTVEVFRNPWKLINIQASYSSDRK